MPHNKLLHCLKIEAAKIEQIMHEDLAAVEDPLLAEITQYALFNGGKRVRPALVVLAARLGGRVDEAAYRLAIAFEYLHVATLLHDDVIDHADRRRGRPAANKIYGNSPAILSGDYLHARSLFLIGTLGGNRCLEIICRATAAMVAGEFLQMRNAGNLNQSEQDYFTVVENKTAFLIAAACEIGAIFAGHAETNRQALRAYGFKLGKAFQLIDDLLDYQGDPGQTGKAVGNDFCEGKMTLPLIHAMATAAPTDRDLFMALLTGPRQERQNQLDTARSLIERYGGFHYAGQQAELLIDQALAGLDIFAAGDAKDLLVDLAHYVLARDK